MKIVKPIKAVQLDTTSDFYTYYPLREWAPIKKIQRMIRDNISGQLCSIRITWQRPKKDASNEEEFLYETLAGILDGAWLLAGAPLEKLFINRVGSMNNLFGLATFSNNIVAEIEVNECLPNSMPFTLFVKANFERGHGTNQPIVGHFNEEGSLLATDSTLHRLIVENSEWANCDEMDVCHKRLLRTIDIGEYPKGPLNSRQIITMIKEACA